MILDNIKLYYYILLERKGEKGKKSLLLVIIKKKYIKEKRDIIKFILFIMY